MRIVATNTATMMYSPVLGLPADRPSTDRVPSTVMRTIHGSANELRANIRTVMSPMITTPRYGFTKLKNLLMTSPLKPALNMI